MKHAHIGLVALAAMVIAGCGGGSDNGDGGSGTKATPVALNGVTGFTVGEDGTGETILTKGDQPGPDGSTLTCTPDEGSTGCTLSVERVPVLGTLKVTSTGGMVTVTPKKTATDSSDKGPGSTAGGTSSPVNLNGVAFLSGSENSREIPLRSGTNSGPGGSTLRCTPTSGSSGCTLTVTRSGSRITAMSTGGRVVVTAAPRPTTPPPTVTQDDVDNALEQGQKQGQDQAEDAQRAPGLVAVLAGTLTERTATVSYAIGQNRRTISVSGAPSAKSAPSIGLSGGWTGTEFSATASATHGPKAYVYTNIATPTSSAARREFWKVHGAENLAVTVDTDEDTAVVDEPEGIDSSIKITGSRAIPSTVDTDTSTPVVDFGTVSVDATFGGTPGKLICTSGCARSDNTQTTAFFKRTNGKPDFVSGTWDEFKANRLTNRHDRPQDETYLYFGYWMNKPRDPSGTPGFHWIHGGSTDSNDVTLTAGDLSGSAKFVGRAVGQYAINTPGASGETSLGMFTAKATLTADFDEDSLFGEITDFQADSPSVADWVLLLRGDGTDDQDEDFTGVTGGGLIQATDNVSEIAGVPVSGTWSATVYGVDNEDVPDDVGEDTCSSSAGGCGADLAGFVGRFNASDNRVADAEPIVAIGGAFAATPQ